MTMIKKLRRLKQGDRFKSYGKDDIELVCIARTKRGSCRDVEIEGKEGTYSMRSDDTVELIGTSLKKAYARQNS